MSNAPTTLEARDAAGRGLRVEFIRRGDRFTHIVSRLDGEQATAIWEAVEGTDAEDWPPSPPLQQLSLETLPDGRRVALLVGMAGTSHWSLSVEPARGEAALIFDVACRFKQPPVALGSRYRRSTDGASENAPQILAACDEPAASGAARCSVRLAEPLLSITPIMSSELPPRTVRWKYLLTFRSSS